MTAETSPGDATATVTADDARTLLRSLVETPSPSGEESAAAAVLVDFFRSRGREAFVDRVGNVRAPADDGVLLTSHVDTVPGEIPVDVADDDGTPVLWGRGAVDATGALAAMAAAAVRTRASFAGVVGEETDSRGARHLVADRDPPDAVVNGEPGGWDGLALGYRGFLAGEYAVATESTHSSRPDANAVELAMSWWTDVTDELAATEDVATAAESEGDVFETVTAKPVAVEGGLASDGLAVEATVDVQFRLPPGVDADAVAGLVDEATADGSVQWNDPIPPWLGTPRCALARALRRAIRSAGGDPRHVRKTGTCDANIYAGTWDCPVVTYGPGDSSLDHTPDERLSLGEFDRALTVLTDVAGEVTD